MRYDNRHSVAPALVAAMFVAACSQSEAPDDAKSLPTTLLAVLARSMQAWSS
jgi:phage tail sheath gpL-like